MRRGRLVGRHKHLVCVNTAAVQFAPETLIAGKNLFPALSISVCLLETGYPIFIWLGKTRTFYLVAIITMRLAIGLAMGVVSFCSSHDYPEFRSLRAGFRFQPEDDKCFATNGCAARSGLIERQ
jgi:hypothetical protein